MTFDDADVDELLSWVDPLPPHGIEALARIRELVEQGLFYEDEHTDGPVTVWRRPTK